jgi:hypothetical protein
MSRIRVSRGLFAGVGAVIVIGGVAYLNKVKNSNAADTGKVVETSGINVQANAAKPQAAGNNPTAAATCEAQEHGADRVLPGAGRGVLSQTPGDSNPGRLPPANRKRLMRAKDCRAVVKPVAAPKRVKQRGSGRRRS